jgi:hypothetical protein
MVRVLTRERLKDKYQRHPEFDSIWQKISGVWTRVQSPDVKVGGSWETPDEVSVKVGGTWRDVWPEQLPLGMLIFHRGSGTPPAAFTYCDGNNGTIDLKSGVHPRIEAVPGSISGSNTHVHSQTHNTGSPANNAGSSGIFNQTKCSPSHTHTFSHSHSSRSHEPRCERMKPYMVTGETNRVPDGDVLYIASASAQLTAGWIYWSSLNGRFLKFDSVGGGLGGAMTHGHSSQSFYTGNACSAASRSGNSFESGQIANHYHSDTHLHQKVNNLPPHMLMQAALVSNYPRGGTVFPGLGAFFDRTTVPTGWTQLTGAYDGRFIQCNSVVDFTLRGASSHSHSDYNGTRSTTGTLGGSCTGVGTNGNSYPGCSHSHNWTHSTHTGTNVPRYCNLMFCIKD